MRTSRSPIVMHFFYFNFNVNIVKTRMLHVLIWESLLSLFQHLFANLRYKPRNGGNKHVAHVHVSGWILTVLTCVEMNNVDQVVSDLLKKLPGELTKKQVFQMFITYCARIFWFFWAIVRFYALLAVVIIHELSHSFVRYGEASKKSKIDYLDINDKTPRAILSPLHCSDFGDAVETTVFSRAYLDFTNVLLIAESKGSNGFFSPMSE